MTRRPFSLLLALMGVLALLAAACDPGDPVDVDDELVEDPDEVDPDPDPEPDPEVDPEEEPPEGRLVVAISSEPDRFDPYFTTASPAFKILENVYDTLVEPSPVEQEMEPALATDWEFDDEGTTWTFELRDDVVWHNGRDFTADDVVFSFERMIDPDEGSLRVERLEMIESVEALDDATVQFNLSRPTPNFLDRIGGFKGLAIMPEEIVEEGVADDEPVGTGPFRFVSYEPGVNVLLEVNPDYWGEGPYVDELEFRFIPEGTVAMTSLRTGAVHWTDNIPAVEIEEVLADPDLEADSVPSIDYWYYTVNFDREPFDDIRVRQALAFGFDREAVTQAAMFEAATPNQTAIPEDSPWHLDFAPFEHDPDRAMELLEEAGADDLEIDLMVTDEFEETITAAETLESFWNEIGVDVSIRVLDFSAWLDEQGGGNFDAFLLGWLGNNDPEDFYHHQHVCDGQFNFHGYCNEEVDELLFEARQEMDEDRRKELYDEAQQIIVEEASYTYLYNPDIVAAWAPELSGFTVPAAESTLRFHEVRFDE